MEPGETRSGREDSAPELRNPTESLQVVRVVAVNGTFASRTGWIEEDSAFWTEVRKHTTSALKIEPFRWPGSNSHRARLLAAERLSARLLEIHEKAPRTPIFVVGHSHGANVALHAARLSANVPTRIVCLGTPFLRARARATGRTVRWARILIPRALLYPVLVPLVLWLIDNFEPAFGLSMAKGLTIAFIPVIGAFWWAGRALQQLVSQKLATWLRSKQENLLRNVASPPPTNSSLAIEAAGDEAAWWLRMLDRLAGLPFLPFQAPLLGVGLLIVVMHCIASPAEALNTGPLMAPIQVLVEVVLPLLLPSLLLLFVALPIIVPLYLLASAAAYQLWLFLWSWLLPGSPVGYGGGALMHWLLEVRIDDPSSRQDEHLEFHHVELKGRRHRLRHSLLWSGDPIVALEVAEFLER